MTSAPERILVDTSAWIEGFRRNANPALINTLARLIQEGRVVTTGIVVTELLRGTLTAKERGELETLFEPFEHLVFPESCWREGGRLGFTLQRKGLTVPVGDLLVAIVSLHHGCTIFHRDEHFIQIAKHIPLHLLENSTP